MLAVKGGFEGSSYRTRSGTLRLQLRLCGLPVPSRVLLVLAGVLLLAALLLLLLLLLLAVHLPCTSRPLRVLLRALARGLGAFPLCSSRGFLHRPPSSFQQMGELLLLQLQNSQGTGQVRLGDLNAACPPLALALGHAHFNGSRQSCFQGIHLAPLRCRPGMNLVQRGLVQGHEIGLGCNLTAHAQRGGLWGPAGPAALAALARPAAGDKVWVGHAQHCARAGVLGRPVVLHAQHHAIRCEGGALRRLALTAHEHHGKVHLFPAVQAQRRAQGVLVVAGVSHGDGGVRGEGKEGRRGGAASGGVKRRRPPRCRLRHGPRHCRCNGRSSGQRLPRGISAHVCRALIQLISALVAAQCRARVSAAPRCPCGSGVPPRCHAASSGLCIPGRLCVAQQVRAGNEEAHGVCLAPGCPGVLCGGRGHVRRCCVSVASRPVQALPLLLNKGA